MSKIGDNPKIKLLKKNARQRSLLENLETDVSSYGDIHDLIDSESFDYSIEEKKDIRHLKGKYERYRLDATKNVVYKDILTIQPDGKVIIRSLKNIYSGVANYLLNATLHISINMQNEVTPIAMNMLMFVGRNDKEDIQCMHALCLTTNADNQAAVQHELLIPILKQETTTLPQRIVVDSLDFYKLNYRLPELMRSLQQRTVSVPTKVDW
ncbi:hypothetical protein [Telluribacter sp.]|jgi:hypothetical protein|uniref:hypothetical protein n=1 Tax=Telluribacter sp. TaxID=1978767 RepID=UPI002E151027|nr:hypothetical protein [Telluribacter sp.]